MWACGGALRCFGGRHASAGQSSVPHHSLTLPHSPTHTENIVDEMFVLSTTSLYNRYHKTCIDTCSVVSTIQRVLQVSNNYGACVHSSTSSSFVVGANTSNERMRAGVHAPSYSLVLAVLASLARLTAALAAHTTTKQEAADGLTRVYVGGSRVADGCERGLCGTLGVGQLRNNTTHFYCRLLFWGVCLLCLFLVRRDITFRRHFWSML